MTEVSRQLPARQPSIPDVNFPQTHTDFHFSFSSSMAFGGHQTFRQLYVPWEKTESTLAFHLWKAGTFLRMSSLLSWAPHKSQDSCTVGVLSHFSILFLSHQWRKLLFSGTQEFLSQGCSSQLCWAAGEWNTQEQLLLITSGSTDLPRQSILPDTRLMIKHLMLWTF